MIKHALKKLLPASIRYLLRQVQAWFFKRLRTIYCKVFRNMNSDMLTGKRVLLNIACGKLIRDGWINVDILPEKGAFFLNVAKTLPFQDGQVRHIHCEHFLEHIDYSIAGRFLKECHRVLEPCGSIRIILPDAETYFRAYCKNDTKFFEKLKTLGGTAEPFRTPLEIINQMFRMGGDHRFAWDFETLELNLRTAGFADVRRSAFGDIPQQLNIDGTDDWRLLESLYINAAKPDNPSAPAK